VNFGGYKNQVGTIVQPEFILIDTSLLETLPDEEFRNGMGEVIKTATIGDPELFTLLEHESERILAREKDLLEEVIQRCIEVKAGIVNRDINEMGIRAILNYGHTIGHAIESNTGMPHGEAVAFGMIVESQIAKKLGLTPDDEAERLKSVIKAFGLPVELNIDPEALAQAIEKDKKAAGDSIKFPVVGLMGICELIEIKLEDLKRIINDLC